MKETYHYDDAQDRLYIKHEEDVSPILQHLENVRKVSDGRGDTSLGYFVGTIPEVVVLDYCKTAGITYQEFMNNNEHIHRIMNNPDYKKFRVFQGRI